MVQQACKYSASTNLSKLTFPINKTRIETYPNVFRQQTRASVESVNYFINKEESEEPHNKQVKNLLLEVGAPGAPDL